MARSRPPNSIFITLILLLTLPNLATSTFNASARFDSIYDAIPELVPLRDSPGPKRPPSVGGQNFGTCCLKAVAETYVIQNQQISGPRTIPGLQNPFLGSKPEEFNNSQFPCGAKYGDGIDSEGAPQVTVPYTWCRDNCGGWQRSSNANLGQWVQPFVGFILPSTVFCLNVPRRSVLNIFDGLFHNHFEDLPRSWWEFTTALKALIATIKTYLLVVISCYPKRKPKPPTNDEEKQSATPHSDPSASMPEKGQVFQESQNEYGDKTVKTLINLISYILIASFFMVVRATIASAISLINTVFWVAVVFSTAGPMMLSGLYEARLDRKVVSGMLKGVRTESFTNTDGGRAKFYRRVGGLYVILVGNLEFGKEKTDVVEKEKAGEKKGDGEGDVDSGKHVEDAITPDKTNEKKEIVERSVWDDINTLVKPKDLIDAEKDADEANALKKKLSKDFTKKLTDLQNNYRRTTEARLKSMLDCQASFGAVVGAAVVFFVGSFLFSVIQNLSAVGDNDTSHALAFGMWWMIVPHVAIVSGCLLAGNNPNTLEVIMCSIREPWDRQEDKNKGWWWRSWWQRFYSSVYVPVRMVERGMNKRLWVRRLVSEYPLKSEVKQKEGEKTDEKADGEKSVKKEDDEDELDIELDLWDWVAMGGIVVILMGLPFILAFLTSFYTPAVGLSCRTFTFLLYFCFQVAYMAIWGWEFYAMKPTTLWRTTSAKQAQSTNRVITRGIERDPEKNPIRTNTASSNDKPSKLSQFSTFVHKLLLGFIILGSAFTSVFGTFFQLVGLYRNCLCFMPIKYWGSGDFSFSVSSNTKDDIAWARKVWLPTGVTSIVLMIVTCYIGWWYQRHWRVQFRLVVKLLLGSPKIVSEKVDKDGKDGKKKVPKRPKHLKDGNEGSWVYVPAGTDISKIIGDGEGEAVEKKTVVGVDEKSNAGGGNPVVRGEPEKRDKEKEGIPNSGKPTPMDKVKKEEDVEEIGPADPK